MRVYFSRLEFVHAEPTRWIFSPEVPADQADQVVLTLDLDDDQAAKLSAYLLGSRKSPRKAKTSAENGKLGGRPRKDRNLSDGLDATPPAHPSHSAAPPKKGALGGKRGRPAPADGAES